MLRLSRTLLKKIGFSRKQGGLVQLISVASQTKFDTLSEQDVRIALLKGLFRINNARFDNNDLWTKQKFNDDLCLDDLEVGDKLDVLLGYKKDGLLIFRVNVDEIKQNGNQF